MVIVVWLARSLVLVTRCSSSKLANSLLSAARKQKKKSTKPREYLSRTGSLRHGYCDTSIDQTLPLGRDDSVLCAVEVVTGREGGPAGRGPSGLGELLDEKGREGLGEGGDGGAIGGGLGGHDGGDAVVFGGAGAVVVGLGAFGERRGGERWRLAVGSSGRGSWFCFWRRSGLFGHDMAEERKRGMGAGVGNEGQLTSM